jgi:hypothetical protein
LELFISYSFLKGNEKKDPNPNEYKDVYYDLIDLVPLKLSSQKFGKLNYEISRSNITTAILFQSSLKISKIVFVPTEV